MLTEAFIASISAPSKPNTGVAKDAGIFLHEFQPLPAQRGLFKKSVTPPNCLAVSAAHIFAAQAEKAVVHVYNREQGTQEAIVPFPERIHSLALAASDTVLLLGTESGRVLLWETCTGRLVSTPTSHLQQVTALAADPTSNFFLSGSTDSIIHVWSLPALLSFSLDTIRTPIHTLSIHRGPINALITGHSASFANIAISASQDNSAIVWDYQSGKALRTYLLEATPISLSLDPADRAFYASYEDGSIQTIDFFDHPAQQDSATSTLRDPTLSHRPIQPSPKTRFNTSSAQNLGPALSQALSYDGTTLLTGHSSGGVATWEIAKRKYITTLATLPGPVTNLLLLPPTGFPSPPSLSHGPNFKVAAVVKPRLGAGNQADGDGGVPGGYTVNIQLRNQLNTPPISATTAHAAAARISEFEIALTHPTFPAELLNAGLVELAAYSAVPVPADFMALAASEAQMGAGVQSDGSGCGAGNGRVMESPVAQIKEMRAQLGALQRVQKATFKQLAELREERAWWIEKEERREARKRRRAARRREGLELGGEKVGNGSCKEVDGGAEEDEDEDEEMDNGDEEMGDESESEEVDSSSSDDDEELGDLEKSSGSEDSGVD
ncbi:WD40 repeat-like protein [Lepidopterella palustris CBS 459.81]|uniref:Pre-rRNA-processing protein IPI3 n=1 Tax=Lepidopterella palustris CBS 459.81 TaxID=1314670 RepID=A0A8E2EDG2_9PEZI|nr:WD40 repeat-like protein [Lepidopterella palustris CBS 459.81]